MTDLAGKLQLKGAPVRVVDAPPAFTPDFRTTAAADEDAALLVFVRTNAELARHARVIIAAARADRLTWVAYPKAGQLDTDLNRDIVAKALMERGIRGVRQVAIDDVWSALRFRPG